MTFAQDTDKHADEVCSLIVEQYDLFRHLLHALNELLALALDSLILVDVMDVRIGHLISLARLDVSYTFAAFMKPQIEQVFCNNL